MAGFVAAVDARHAAAKRRGVREIGKRRRGEKKTPGARPGVRDREDR